MPQQASSVCLGDGSTPLAPPLCLGNGSSLATELCEHDAPPQGKDPLIEMEAALIGAFGGKTPKIKKRLTGKQPMTHANAWKETAVKQNRAKKANPAKNLRSEDLAAPDLGMSDVFQKLKTLAHLPRNAFTSRAYDSALSRAKRAGYEPGAAQAFAKTQYGQASRLWVASQ